MGNVRNQVWTKVLIQISKQVREQVGGQAKKKVEETELYQNKTDKL